jgi:hypothetical protein
MCWDFGNYIFATFTDDKLSKVSGSFSESLPVKGISLSNFKRLRIGMTEPEVVDILGKSNGTVTVGSGAYCSWGDTARVSISFNEKGSAFNPGLQESDAVFLPPGVQLPMFELPKR